MRLEDAEKSLIFRCISGSFAYGTNRDDSDIDRRGIFAIPPDSYFKLNKPPEQVSDPNNDTSYYTIHRFFQLAVQGNPNILEFFWVPEDCIEISTPEWERIKAIRQTFITKGVLDAFCGYAAAQIKKAKGQNKLINNPMSEKKPIKEDFVWLIPMHVYPYSPVGDTNPLLNAIHGTYSDYRIIGETIAPPQMPFRPIKLSGSTYAANFNQFHRVAAMEHCINMYRYYYDTASKGVFRGDESADIVCESIPVEDEYKKFAGILIYHKDAYERELKLWHQYWGWKQNRNEARWKDQEGKENPVDFKNMSHCMRLLYSGENILVNGEPLVRFEGEKLQRLKDIRSGLISYEELVLEAEERLAKLDAARKTCSLPTNPDFELVNELSIQLHRQS